VITGPDNLFALPEVEALLREELARVPALATRQPGGRALLLQAHASGRALPVDLRHLGVTRLHVTPAGLGGDVVCAADALPWEDDAFQLVVAQHAGDALARPDELIEQLTRVLAPGGALLWFGLNPLSPWILWLHWRAREGLPLPRAMHAESLRRRLHGKLTPGAAEAIGACWPNRAPAAKRAALLAPLRGAWMLVASKQRAVLTPLQRRPLRSRVTPQPSLAVPNRRVRA